jgi:transmembrane sensor
MGQTEDYIIDIIGKQFNGTATASELQQLEAWLNADPSQRKEEYEAYRQIWEASGELLFPSTVTFDTRSAWDKIDRQVKGAEAPATTKRIPRWLWVAAAAIILLGAGSFWLYKSANRDITLTAETDNQVVNLSDGSVVTLRKGAVLSYPVTFKEGQRSVQLTGQAFFDIQKDARSTFSVQTTTSTIKVLGTSFFVSIASDSVHVTVTSGRIRLEDRENVESYVELSADQSAGLTAHRFVKDSVPNTNYLAWKTGVLDFNNEPLDEVVRDLNSYYGDSVALAPELVSLASTIRVTLHFNKEPLTRVLEEIKLTTGLDSKEADNRTVLFHK